ncbi:MAG: hypothetical protein ACFHXK_18820 [bacterium]
MKDRNKYQPKGLKAYCNEKCFGLIGKGKNFALETIFAAGVLYHGQSTSMLALGALLTVMAVGSANQWNEQATGKPLWKPRLIPALGL